LSEVLYEASAEMRHVCEPWSEGERRIGLRYDFSRTRHAERLLRLITRRLLDGR
jgi:hypothetical protein